jgi:hypothetical protein
VNLGIGVTITHSLGRVLTLKVRVEAQAAALDLPAVARRLVRFVYPRLFTHTFHTRRCSGSSLQPCGASFYYHKGILIAHVLYSCTSGYYAFSGYIPEILFGRLKPRAACAER